MIHNLIMWRMGERKMKRETRKEKKMKVGKSEK